MRSNTKPGTYETINSACWISWDVAEISDKYFISKKNTVIFKFGFHRLPSVSSQIALDFQCFETAKELHPGSRNQ